MSLLFVFVAVNKRAINVNRSETNDLRRNDAHELVHITCIC